MLRNVVEGDLRTFFEHQRDPEAASMAAFPPREWEAFISHWRHNVLGGQANEVRTIPVDDQVAGYVSSWEQEGRRLVAYWVGREYWGRGIAYRAAKQVLDHGFGVLKLREIVSFTAAVNERSRRLMERLEFSRDAAGDFDHPAIPDGHELRRHVLYRKRA